LLNNNFRSGFVALVGRPNAGKSTLLNQLVGQKIAIMSEKPQTTRNRIVGVLTKENWQLIFLDTPGIHKPYDQMGQYMVKVALRTLQEVDLIYYLVDITQPYGGGEAYIIDKLKKVSTPVFLLLNKIDLVPKKDLLPLMDFYRGLMDWKEIIPVSALKGENTTVLIEATLPYLVPGPCYYPPETITDQPEQLLMAELIREKVIELTRKEVPHSVAVEVERVEKKSSDLLKVWAVIYVERMSKKGIVIGKNGEMLKNIGTRARREMENLLGSRIYLELWVKVKKDWRSKEKSLQDLGYTIDN
jgi:GTP-binding protein Era